MVIPRWKLKTSPAGNGKADDGSSIGAGITPYLRPTDRGGLGPSVPCRSRPRRVANVGSGVSWSDLGPHAEADESTDSDVEDVAA